VVALGAGWDVAARDVATVGEWPPTRVSRDLGGWDALWVPEDCGYVSGAAGAGARVVDVRAGGGD
jgi:hypothetical protein